MTDNGSAYRSHLIADLCRSRRMRRIFSRSYTPRTNGKAERFIQTALREWAYARPYNHSQQRAQALLHWLHSYNHHRPHQGIAAKLLSHSSQGQSLAIRLANWLIFWPCSQKLFPLVRKSARSSKSRAARKSSTARSMRLRNSDMPRHPWPRSPNARASARA